MKEKRIEKVIEIGSGTRRQIQLIQLEILVEIDSICRKHHINYRLIGGTLLGAVRHKGFIPWDPDVDISMSRSAYSNFFEVCKKELDESRFFLQEWRTDPNYRWNYARVLRKDTVFQRAGHEHLNQKTGIFVDIICSDTVPDSPTLRPLHCFSCFAIRKILWSKVGKKLHENWFMRRWYTILSWIPRNAVFRYRDWVISWAGENPTQLIRNMAHEVSKNSSSRWGYQVADIDMAWKFKNGELPWDYSSTDLEFEGRYFMALKTYDLVLKTAFTNYMELPPKEKRVSHIPCSKLKLVVPDLDDFEELMLKQYNE
ncbi:MAG TPA: LicD family protein [Clostridia bacterium]|nr:LicD family protein [Clostridia bacterium]